MDRSRSDLHLPHISNKNDWPWEVTPDSLFVFAEDSNWPKISVITPSFNQAQYLEATIRSVLLQGYPNLEYIIIDGGSRDGSVDIIRKYESWITYWVSEPDHGQSHAINKGFSLATGEWVGWLNSDDLYLPNTFAQIANTAKENPTTAWIVGGLIYADEQLIEFDRIAPRLRADNFRRHPAYQVGSWLDFICMRHSGTFLPQPASFWQNTAMHKAGLLDEQFRYAMDSEYFGRLAHQGYTPFCIDVPLAIFRKHSQQKTFEGRIPFLNEELNIIDLWLPQVSQPEQMVLKRYRSWLQNQIFRIQIKSFLDRIHLLKIYQRSRRFMLAVANASHLRRNKAGGS